MPVLDLLLVKSCLAMHKRVFSFTFILLGYIFIWASLDTLQFTTLFQISHVSDKDLSVWLWLYLGHLDENS